jgi:hypothetical protein
MQELRVRCDAYEKPGQQRDKRNKKTFSLEWQFYMGRSILALTTLEANPIWSHKHSFKTGKGVYMKSICDFDEVSRKGLVCEGI